MSLSDLELVDNLPDEDDLFGELDEVFPVPYHLAHSASLGNSYVLYVDANLDNSLYLASMSSRQVKVLTPLLTTLSTLSPHEKTVTKSAFSKTNKNLLFTSSSDCSIRLWDIRSPDKPCTIFQDTTDASKQDGPPDRKEKPLTCFDTSADSRVVCAGTERVGQDSYLLFWDIRSGPLMGGYWESHDDDITCIKFHPSKNDCMASGSTDGLVNVFDLSEGKEEDALVSCHNTEDSVSDLHWFSKKDQLRYLAISTHTEGLQLWDTDHYQPYQSFTRSEVAHGIRRKNAEHVYIVGAHAQQDQGFHLLAGSRYAASPCLRLATLKNRKLKPEANLPVGPGSGIVRSSVQLAQYSGLLSGSEGGVVSVWRPGPQTQSEPSANLKIKNKSNIREKPY